MSSPHQPGYLARILAEKLSLEEFKNLCLDLDVRFDDLGGEAISGKARALVDYLHRRGRLRDLRDALARARPDIPLATTPGERLPYVGLRTFQEQDEDLFFGREALVEKVKASPFLAVLGASGSGSGRNFGSRKGRKAAKNAK